MYFEYSSSSFFFRLLIFGFFTLFLLTLAKGVRRIGFIALRLKPLLFISMYKLSFNMGLFGQILPVGEFKCGELGFT